ncbi:hypothetical protein C1645_816123 [Glomus cerebriforme]|uniref:Uncharacterized protein n=1 Tax=Glomus cerebriforme TaxID=658196 RepID=A0A397TLD6_9GLOM|nr:hypothetical protein C1645_816123 [Glomus cerebriforme]
MSNNRFNCYLHDHKFIVTPPPPSQPDHSQLNSGYPKTISSHRLGWNYAKSFPTFPRANLLTRRIYYSHFTFDFDPFLKPVKHFSARDKKFFLRQSRYFRKADTDKGRTIITHLSHPILSCPSIHLGLQPEVPFPIVDSLPDNRGLDYSDVPLLSPTIRPGSFSLSPPDGSLPSSDLYPYVKKCLQLLTLHMSFPSRSSQTDIYQQLCFLYSQSSSGSALYLLTSHLLSFIGSCDYSNHVFVPHTDRRLDLSFTSQPLPLFLEFHWMIDGDLSFNPFFNSARVFDDSFPARALLFNHVISFFIEEFCTNRSLSPSTVNSYFDSLSSARNSIPTSVTAYSILTEFLVSCADAGLNSAILILNR